MRVAVFGGEGLAGRPAIGCALAAGHDVVALAREPEALPGIAEGVRAVRGEARDAEAVERAVRGCNAVLWCDERGALAEVRAVLGAMARCGVARGVFLGAPPPGATGALERAVREGAAEWTVVRTGWRTGGPGARDYVATLAARRPWWLCTTARADAADFMVREAFARDFVRRTVGVFTTGM
jgi:uncharacterized protein YbjT (DUF2867 family)